MNPVVAKLMREGSTEIQELTGEVHLVMDSVMVRLDAPITVNAGDVLSMMPLEQIRAVEAFQRGSLRCGRLRLVRH